MQICQALFESLDKVIVQLEDSLTFILSKVNKKMAELTVNSIDSIINTMTGTGTGSDKNSFNTYVNDCITDVEAEEMYRSSWVAGKLVDIPAQDSTRLWRLIASEKREEIEAFERSINLRRVWLDALISARLYGGSVLIMDVAGEAPETPIGNGKLLSVRQIDKSYISSYGSPHSNPFDASFGLPESYAIGGMQIHHSRVIRVDGTHLPTRVRAKTNFWGDSILNRAKDYVAYVDAAYSGVASLMHELNVETLRMKGLLHALGDNDAETAIQKRIAGVKLGQSIHRMRIIDGEEEIMSSSPSLAGIKDVLREFIQVVSAAESIPPSRFLGETVAGLGDAGNSQMKIYHDTISSLQNRLMRNGIDRIDTQIQKTLGVPEYDWDFVSLAGNTEREQADTRKVQVETANLALALVPEEEVLRQLVEDGAYNFDVDEVMNFTDDRESPDGG